MGFFDPWKSKEPPLYSGGSGETMATAVIINTTKGGAGVHAEYDFIAAQCGVRNTDWKLVRQILLNEGGKSYDQIVIELANGQTRNFFFDISQFFGKR